MTRGHTNGHVAQGREDSLEMYQGTSVPFGLKGDKRGTGRFVGQREGFTEDQMKPKSRLGGNMD